jgi:hypothetical protein
LLGAAAPETSIAENFCVIVTAVVFYQSRLFAMDRSKIVAVATGIISIGLAIAYLLIVQIIDSRGEMLPAPITETLFQGLLKI